MSFRLDDGSKHDGQANSTRCDTNDEFPNHQILEKWKISEHKRNDKENPDKVHHEREPHQYFIGPRFGVINLRHDEEELAADTDHRNENGGNGNDTCFFVKDHVAELQDAHR